MDRNGGFHGWKNCGPKRAVVDFMVDSMSRWPSDELLCWDLLRGMKRIPSTSGPKSPPKKIPPPEGDADSKKVWTTLPETNIAMENPPFWLYLPGKMGFSWAMLVSGRVILNLFLLVMFVFTVCTIDISLFFTTIWENMFALRILTPQNWLFWGPNPCVIQVHSPFHWRVKCWSLGWNFFQASFSVANPSIPSKRQLGRVFFPASHWWMKWTRSLELFFFSRWKNLSEI